MSWWEPQRVELEECSEVLQPIVKNFQRPFSTSGKGPDDERIARVDRRRKLLYTGVACHDLQRLLWLKWLTDKPDEGVLSKFSDLDDDVREALKNTQNKTYSSAKELFPDLDSLHTLQDLSKMKHGEICQTREEFESDQKGLFAGEERASKSDKDPWEPDWRDTSREGVSPRFEQFVRADLQYCLDRLASYGKRSQ